MTVTYQGSTFTTTSANPPLLLYSVVGGKVQYPGVLATSSTLARGGKLWFYCSTNAPADMNTAGCISDGGVLGMAPGDLMIGVTFGTGGGISSTDMFPYMGVLNSTNSSLSTAAYNITSNYST